MSDLQTLEAIQHPALFTKSTLSCLLKHSCDDAMLSCFITSCDSTLLNVRVVSWAAKYEVVELLPTIVDKLTSQGEKLLRIFGSAVKHDHGRVLDWVNNKREHCEQLWRFRLAKTAAQEGRLRVLLWLYEHQKVDRLQMNALAGIVAQFGHLWCLRGLYEALEVVCAFSDLLKAVRRNHMDVVECILRHQPVNSVHYEQNKQEVAHLRAVLGIHIEKLG